MFVASGGCGAVVVAGGGRSSVVVASGGCGAVFVASGGCRAVVVDGAGRSAVVVASGGIGCVVVAGGDCGAAVVVFGGARGAVVVIDVRSSQAARAAGRSSPYTWSSVSPRRRGHKRMCFSLRTLEIPTYTDSKLMPLGFVVLLSRHKITRSHV